MTAPLKFRLLSERFAINRLAPHQAIDPQVLGLTEWISVTRTGNEISVVAPESVDLGAARRQAGWVCLGVDQVLDFSLVGVLAAISTTLAAAGVSIFAVSTYDTDYILVRADSADRAVAALRIAGHEVELPLEGIDRCRNDSGRECGMP